LPGAKKNTSLPERPMQPKTTPPATERQARLLAELRRDTETRQAGYRARALKLFPHVCARCGREFEGKRLRELTVHHKDVNHDNNPTDGSNWELLCVYCHDHEHAPESERALGGSGPSLIGGRETSALANPFEGLDALIKTE
jgi:5-methylcytosine-specific restriction endonuclease McrA